ncbi:hypothetical protein [Leucobacter tenebrionis]|uniref:hypothetical protein n=1 Tax=Leucobacter tenebrionis TaxID=2873270 RepID=UPI001CA61999|nr:hypothetical protein [Leucobacter tenebrionis]QZY51335.1 hypothetical protein KVY00_12205 [Leucobacter tenebrionis]
MEHDEIDGLDSMPVRVTADDGYRARALCGDDCEPDPSFGFTADKDASSTKLVVPSI